MLAKTWEPGDNDRFGAQSVFVQPKLDGIRCLADLETGTLGCGERRKITFGESDNHISAAPKGSRLQGGPRFVDGELYTDGMGFQDIVSIARRTKAPSDRVHELHFHVYDAVCDIPFRERSRVLQEWHATLETDGAVKRVSTTLVSNDAATILENHETFVADSTEGCMVRLDSDAPCQRESDPLLLPK